jgi:lipopolysaccharide/colanic/teichoic acid biosynthesis glycosyltransferase
VTIVPFHLVKPDLDWYDTPVLKATISPYYFSWKKRLFDIALSVLGITLLWPLLILVSIAIFVTAGWPIFFFQKRVGQHKKVFSIIKFRTMKIGSESKRRILLKKNEAPWPMFKLQNDPRYTKIGRFLSRTGVDELPQLINILKGEMSLVGPRPLPVYEAKKLPENWNFRYKVKPGIISEWVLNKKRYHSLTIWKKLEERTIVNGGVSYDIKLGFRTLNYLFPFFVKR